MIAGRDEIIWAAGLFEGEGSICWSKHKNRNNFNGEPYHTIQLSLHSTDEDVVCRFAKAVGVGGVNGPYIYVDKKVPDRKPSWYWAVASHERCQAVIAMLWPWLCSRRRAKAKECLVLELIERPIKRKGPPRDVETGKFMRLI
jgi:hypothetical protein